MKRYKPRTKSADLLRIIDTEYQAALPGQDALSNDRTEALRYYTSETADIDDGLTLSNVVTTDVHEVVETIHPQLMEIFGGSEDVIEWMPQGPEDEAAAQQETDAIQHVFYVTNDGYLVIYDAIKDGLLQRAGYAKFWVDEATDCTIEHYTGLTDDALATLLADDGVSLLEAAPSAEGTDACVKRIARTKGIRVAAVPPEDLVFSDDGMTSFRDKQYACHRRQLRVCDLLALGIAKDLIDKVPSASNSVDAEKQERARAAGYPLEPVSDRNDVLRTVDVEDHYIRVDDDGDDIPELIRVLTGGKSSARTVLLKEFADIIPFAGWSPIRIPHQQIGRSVVDQAIPFQRINTAITRTMLDTAYYSANRRPVLNEMNIGRNTMETLANNKPGEPILLAAGQLQWSDPPQRFGEYILGLEHFGLQREEATGAKRYNPSLDNNALNSTARGATLVVNAAMQRVKVIAQLFAQQFLTDLFYGIHQLMIKGGFKKQTMRLRGSYVEINPSEWHNRTDMRLTLGIGPGVREQQSVMLDQILGVQMQTVQLQGGVKGPYVTYKHIFETLRRKLEIAGFKNTEAFFPSVESVEQAELQSQDQQQQQPSPDEVKLQQELVQLEIEKVKLQLEQVKLQNATWGRTVA